MAAWALLPVAIQRYTVKRIGHEALCTADRAENNGIDFEVAYSRPNIEFRLPSKAGGICWSQRKSQHVLHRIKQCSCAITTKTPVEVCNRRDGFLHVFELTQRDYTVYGSSQ